MTATPILESLAREFSVHVDDVRSALEMTDAGLSAPFIGRFRRAQVGLLSESALRRMTRRRQELEELDRRRGTILRLLEKESNVPPALLAAIQTCMDRFELEDLFIPHRRPEPEVQLALDRGLGGLADLLVAPIPKAEREAMGAEASPDVDAPADAPATPVATHAEPTPEVASPDASVAAEASASTSVDETPIEGEVDAQPASASEDTDEVEEDKPSAPTLEALPSSTHANIDVRTAMNAHLARVCMPFVRPDKGVHTETEALSGALRILSDRLGRNPRLRSAIRKLLGKHGVLSVRATVPEGRVGRHRSLLKVRQPLHQLQGHRLLAIRQAQKERVVNTIITLDPAKAMPHVRAALGRHTHPAHEEVLDEVALQALNHRLLPMIEQDVRLELKERADAEALRFLSQHLRQILLAPSLGRRATAGIDVNAKGDWTVATLDASSEVSGPDVRIETGEKDAATLGAELRAVLEPLGIHAVGVGHGKGPRAAVVKLRAALRAASYDATVFIVNEAGLSSYANSEIARHELGDRAVPARMAISLGRRLQDALPEILKVDPRHLGLGVEQGLVSKANARRTFVETIESCTAHVGCDVNYASAIFLQHLPGLDREAAQRIVARRKERPFQNREELRADGILTEAQWISAIAFLRVSGSPEPLDATGLHPEQYTFVRSLLDSAGLSVDQALGRPGVTRGLNRGNIDVDEATWRDWTREIAFPGRDPRLRLFIPQLLDPETDPVRLVPDRVVEGIVSNVASFGAFVDVGLPADAMVHISEISDRYVRDAREYLSIGQHVRARIVDATGPRLSLSLKRVPPRVRDDQPREGGGGGRGRFDGPRRQGGGRRGEGRDDRRGPQREPAAPVRAAQTRRDGLGTRSSGGGRGGPGGGKGRGGPGRGDGRGGHRDRGDRGDRDERVPLDAMGPARAPAFSPFASFFKSKQGDKKPE